MKCSTQSGIEFQFNRISDLGRVIYELSHLSHSYIILCIKRFKFAEFLKERDEEIVNIESIKSSTIVNFILNSKYNLFMSNPYCFS